MRLPYVRGRQQIPEGLSSPAKALTSREHDAFGRLAAIYAPSPELPLATELALKVTFVDKAPTPHVIAQRRVDIDKYITAIDVFNGVGEYVFGFDQADVVVSLDADFLAATGFSARLELRGVSVRRDDLDEPLARLERTGVDPRKSAGAAASEVARDGEDDR